MAEYTVFDNSTKREVTFEWNDPNPPTDADMEEVFAAASQQNPAAPSKKIFGEQGGSTMGIASEAGKKSAASGKRFLQDTAVDAVKGVVGLGESVVGGLDLVTGNLAGEGLAAVGYDPKKTDEILSSGYSAERQQANANVQGAKGFMETLGALVDNPSVAFGSIVESAPLSLGSAAAARTLAVRLLARAGIAPGTAAATEFFANPATQAKLLAAAAGTEGAMTAGSIQEGGRQGGRDYTDTVLPALAAGAVTGTISAVTSKIPGFKDAEVSAATAGMAGEAAGGILQAGKEIAKSMFKEGVLEELPQSAQEQVFTNLAMGKPWDEGVGEAAAQGMVAGMGQGGGMTAVSETMNRKDAIRSRLDKMRGKTSVVVPDTGVSDPTVSVDDAIAAAAAEVSGGWDRGNRDELLKSLGGEVDPVAEAISGARGSLDVADPARALADPMLREIEGAQLTADPFKDYPLTRPIIQPGAPTAAGGEIVGVEGYRQKDVIPNQPILNDEQQAVQDTFLKGGPALNRDAIDEVLANQNDPNLADEIAKGRQEAEALRQAGQLPVAEQTNPNGAGPSPVTKVDAPAQPLPAPGAFSPPAPKVETTPAAKIETPLSAVQQEFIRGKVKALGSIDAVQAKYGDQAAPVDRYARDFAAQHFAPAKKVAEQAPIAAPTTGPKMVRGRANKAFTAKGDKIYSSFAVVEADDLVASHSADGTPNPKYPQEIQPRNREKVSSQLQIQQMSQALRPAQLGESAKVSSGSPFIGPDGVVESGNGRTLAIRQAYDTDKAGEYRAWLESEAARLDVNPAEIKGMKKPVLVRVRETEVDRPAFAREANQAGMAAMSPAELAKSDAARITPDHIGSLNVGDDGNLLSSGNRPFVSAFLKGLGSSEAAGLTDAQGLPTRQLADRMQAAIFTKAYNDPKLVSMMAEESDVDIKNIITALNAAAPAFVRTEAKEIVGKLTDAIGMIREAKQRGLTLDDFLSQQDMFSGGRDADAETIARGIGGMMRSGKKMAEAFRSLADAAGRNNDYASQGNLLGDKAKTPSEIISDVFKQAGPQAQQQPLLNQEPEAKQPAPKPDNGKSRIENELDELSDDDVANMISSAMAAPTDRPAAKVEKVKRIKAAVVAGKKPRGAASLLADAAKEAGQGFADSLKALAASYGVDESKLSAFPAGFDADGYAKAKPHFLSAWEHYKAAGKGLVEFVQYLGDKLGRLIPGFESQLGYFFGEMRGKHSFEADLAEQSKPAGYQYPDQRPVLTEAGLKDIVPTDYMEKVDASLELPETYRIDTPEREQMREAAAEKLYGDGAKNKDYRVDIILGLAASGKSSVANPIAKEHGSLVLDCDDAKELLPEFDNGNGSNAVHEESSDIFGRAYQRALLAGDNLVLPLVGGSLPSLERRLKALANAGYDVHLHYVDLPMQKSVERLLSRYNETGRLMDPRLIVNNGLHPFKNYSIVKSQGGITNESDQGGQEKRPGVRVGGMAGVDSGQLDDQSGRGSRGGQGEADYRVESATFYNNDKPFGAPNIIVESQTNPTPKPAKGPRVSVQVSAAEGGKGVSAVSDKKLGAKEPDAAGRAEGQDSDEPGAGAPANVGSERPAQVSESAPSGSGDTAIGAADAAAGEGDRGAGGQPAPRPVRNAADVRGPSHVTGSARNFTITNELEFGGVGAKSKFKNNVEAIRTLQTLESEARPATPDEQATLARYVGWGGLPQAFDEKKKDWAKEYAELKALLTPEQYETAVSSTQNAHYTAAEVVKGIWAGVQRLGFDRGSVLEPSMGTGNFFGLMPRELRSMSKMTGVEFDHITGMIAKHLYPQARVHAPLGFQDLQIVPESFDLAIGNPPFGAKPVFDPNSKTLSKFKIHGYFFAKSVDSLRPGGVLAMVVSKGFLDANDATGKQQRDYVAARAKLLGAIRLPDTAFSVNAGTEVTTDIVFLQKLAPGEQGNSAEWSEMGAVQDPATGADIQINKYFVSNPDMMLGEMALRGGAWRAGGAILAARAGEDLGEKLQAAIEKLPKNVMASGKRTTQDLNNAAAASLKNVDSVRPFNFFMENGKLYQRMPDMNGDTQARQLDHIGTTADRIAGMVELRDAVRKQLALEANEKSSDMAIDHNRKVLNTLYDAYVKRYGNLNNDTNKRLFWDDADSPLVRSLEKSFDKGLSKDLAKKQGKEAREASAKKADIFTKRVLSPAMEVTKVESAPDALSASMNEKGRVDFPYMEAIYGKDAEQITKELGESVYEDPSAGWLPASEYLSGNVKAKLAEAINAAKSDPKYGRNVEALDAVQPEDVPAADIFVAPHAFWVPEEVYHQFAAEVLQGTMAGGYSRATHSWNVRFTSSDNTLNTAKLGTGRMSATTIMSTLMANKQIAVYDPNPQKDGARILNASETAAAQGKADELTELFQDWIWKDQARRQKVVRKYNDLMNTTVDARHDGSHMTFPGMSPTFQFRPHQKNAVYRSVQTGVALYDHVVGAGKTAVITATAMELRRLGLAKKPMVTVPNHLVEQWAAAFAKIYPQAKVLAATKKDFKKENRRQLFAKIATGDWDAVIIAHSSFKFIPVPPAIQMEILDEQKAEILQALREAKEDAGKKLSVKKLQEAKDRIEAKIQALADMPKDDLLNFEEMGIDALFTDEAHEFKNLFYTTTMQNVAGLGDPTGSGRAFDMFIKTQYLMRRNGGKGVYFATGTPISNSLAEVFHMQRFLQYGELKARGLANFDAWASAFGLATSDWEQDAGGRYKQKTRFRKLVNLPELKQLWRQVTDTITNPDLIRDAEQQGKTFPLPKIEGGKPQNVVVERSPQQAEYIGIPREKTDDDGNVIVNTENGMPVVEYDPGTIVYRMEHWLDEKKKGNTREMPLVITGDARKAGLDFRLIDENSPDFAGSKTNTAVNEIHEIWKENDHRKGTQLVFIDLSTPKAHKGQNLAKMAETVPTYFVKDRGTIQHVAGKPVKLDAIQAEWEFFSFKKGKSVRVYERMSGLEIGEGANVTEAKANATEKLARIPVHVMEQRFRDQAIPDEQIESYLIDWEEAQASKEDDGDDDGAEKGPEISFDDLLADSGKSDFSVYDDIKTKLIEKGVPADQIAYIHDANTDAQKHDLFAKVNSGVIRVLLGSTAKMGAGTNVQKKLVGLHHLDAPWKPSDLAQREGRIVRQGNEFYYEDPEGFRVKIRRYATKQTYDSRMWEIIETKAKSIELFKTGGKELREIEDVSSESANAAEIKASAAGNPLMLEDLQMKNEIRKYEGMEKSWKRSRYDLEDKVHSVEAKSAYPYKRLADLEKAQRGLQPKNADALGLKLGRVEYNEKEDYNPEEMFRVISRAFTTSMRDTRPVEVGTYRGTDIQVSSGLTQSVRVELMSNGVRIGLTEYTLEDKFSAPGFITRLDNVVDNVANDIRGAKSSIAQLEKDAAGAREELKQPFKHAEKLKELRDQHKRVVSALRQGRTSVEAAPVDAETRFSLNQTSTPAFKKWFGDSKVVDAEGKPLVVYHGTPTGGFTEFSKDYRGRTGGRSRGGFSFATNREAAEGYANAYNDETVILDDAIRKANSALRMLSDTQMEDMGLAPETEFYWGAVDDTDEFLSYLGELADSAKAFNPEAARILKDAAETSREGDPEVYEAYLKVPANAPEFYATPETLGKVVASLDVRNVPGGAAVVNMPNGEKVFYVSDPTQIKSATGNNGEFNPDNPDIRFNRDQTAQGADAAEVRNTLTYFTANMDNAPAWEVVQAESELPAAVQDEINSLDASGAVRGVFTAGKIYIVADNLNAADEAEAVFLHESVAHYGLRGLLGARFKPVLQQIAMVYGNKGLKDIAARYGLNLSKPEDRMTAAEEKLAEMAETADRVGIVKRAIAAVRDWLRQHGFKVEWSDSDIKALLARARGYVERSNSQATTLFDGDRFMIAGPDGRADLPTETKVQAGWRKFQDKYNRVDVLQRWLKEQGVRLSDLANASRGLYTMNGKIADQLSRFMDNDIQPLVQAAAKAKVSLDDISDYLLMQHAEEANEQMRKLHDDPAALAFGVTDAEAAQALADYQARPDFTEFKALADQFQAFSGQTADLLEGNGVISSEMRAAWDGAYKKYVPLRGGEDDTKTGTGKGLRVNGKQQRRSGHGRRDEHVIENIIKARERAIKTVEKNNVALSIAQLIHEAADDRIGTIGKPEKRRVFKSVKQYTVLFQGAPVAAFTNEADADAFVAKDRLANGKPLSDYMLNVSSDPTVNWMTSPMLGDNEINAYINGHQVRIQINDEVAAGALTNLGAEGLGTILSIGKQINNYFSRAYTGYDPRFTIRNTFRDFTAGMVNLTGDYGAATAAKIAANYPKAIREFIKARKDPALSTWVDRYRKQGGSTGASWLSSLERLGEDVEAIYQEQIGSVATYRNVFAAEKAKGRSNMAARVKALGRSGVAGFHKVPVMGHFLKLINAMNTVSENAFRVSTFMTLVQEGKSEAEAGEAAKNSTINFDKRGELGAQMGALWLFFNPAMQGVQRSFFALTQSEHKLQAQALVGSMALAGFMAAELARGMGGDDDDEWDKIPRSVKNRNFVIRTGEKTQITIPLPYEYGSFVGIGYAMNDAVHGRFDKRAGLNLASAIMDGLAPLGNPVSDEGDIQPLAMMPTVAKLVLAPKTNTNSFGSRIAPEKFQESKPDSQNMWRGTKGSVYDRVATGMNEATGGSEYSAGMVDVSPEILKYYTRTLLGGAFTFVDQVVGLGIVGANGAQPDLAEIPMGSVLVRENTVRDTRRMFWDIAKDAKTAIDGFNAAKKNRDVEAARDIRQDKADLLAVAGLAARQAKLAKAKRDAVDAIRLDDSLSFSAKRAMTKELEAQESKIYDRLIERFNQ